MEPSLPPVPASWKKRFFVIWGGQAFSLLGSQLVQFALIWWLTKTTGSATVLAVASLVGLVPHVLLGPIAGTLVDRWNRRLTMIVADSLSALAVVALAALFAFGRVEFWEVYLLMFVRSVAGAFHSNAMMASTTLMVPQEHLARIQGLNQMLWGGMSIFSAPLGALLLEWLPMQGILAIDVSTALLAVIPLLFTSVPQPERKDLPAGTQGKTSVWQDFRAGLRYLWNWPGLLIIVMMAMAVNLLLNPAFSLLPILVSKHFNGGAPQLATLESVSGIGVIAGGLLLSAWGGFKRRVATALMGILGIGIFTFALGSLPSSAFIYAVAVIFMLGISQPITNGPLLAAVQVAVVPEMQGRVFSLIGSLAAAMSPIGLMIAGPVADKVGVQAWFLAGGVVTALVGLVAFFIPAVMNFEKGPNGQAAASQPDSASPAKVELDYT